MPNDDTKISDLSPMDIRLEELRDHFPEAFPDNIFDMKSLMSLFTSAGTESIPSRRFGLDWPGKIESINLLRMPGIGALVPEKSKSVEFNVAQHVFIRGDNLEVMKLMQKAYFGKFKMVYMDPPYNMESDTIYIDDYEDPIGAYLRYSGKVVATNVNIALSHRSGGRIHSTWLSMMLPRLFTARNLMSEDGVIFVSIDDHESHHLRMLMDEVFGLENFVCSFVWEKRYSPPPDAKDVGYVHEIIHCYRRSDAFEAALLPMTKAQRARYKNPDKDPRGDWKAADYTCRFTAEERPTLYYHIVNPNTGKKVWPKKSRVWACSEEEHQNNVSENRIWWPPGSEVPAKKKFASEIRQGAMPNTLLRYKEVGHTDEATKEFRKWFPGLNITPKPTRLIRHMLRIANIKAGDLVLDCFARTGETAEAILNANKEDGIGARFVLIQLPEPLAGDPKRTMADIANERIIRSMKAIRRNNSLGVRSFSLTSSSFKRWEGKYPKDKEGLADQLRHLVDNVDLKRSEDDLLFEVLLKAGIALTTQIKVVDAGGQRVYSLADGAFLVCLERKIKQNCLRVMASLAPERIVCLDFAFEGKDDSENKHSP